MEQEIKKIDCLKKKASETIREGMKSPEEKQEDILFFSPPFWDVYAPFSAVPCLVARLKKEGYKADQIDLGIHCVWHVISKKWKQAMESCISESFFEERVKTYIDNPYESYEQFKKDMWFFQGEKFDISMVRLRYPEMNNVQRGVLEAFYSNIYQMESVDVNFDKCDNLDWEVEERISLSFWETLCDDQILQRLKKLPEVVGISVTSTYQFLPGCALAKIIKQERPDIKIILGGSCVDLFVKSMYKNKKDIKRWFDYVICGEGETALIRLMQYFRGRGKIEEVPNLILFENNQIRYTEQILEDVSQLPPPDYDGLDLDLYLTPGPVLPYQASRGCHYGMCAFCNHDEKYRHNYRTKPAKKVVEELIGLSERYKTNYFQFVDEAIRPDCFQEIVEEMDKHPECREMKWFYYSRVSRKYNKELLQIAKRNGCEMVMFGVETFNQRLLNFIKKGITADTSRYCLELFHKCGIKTYAWLMCNLPSECIEEVKQDYEELINQKQYMDGFAIGPFSLGPNTDMWQNPADYNITSVEEGGGSFLSHHNGVEIDKEEMLQFYKEKYLPLRNHWNFTGSRYALFFK